MNELDHNLTFKDSSGKPITAKKVIQEIINFMQADEKQMYKIVIGTDSEKLTGTQADFVTAVVVHRVGKGGRYFWRRIFIDKLYTLRDRIWREVLVSLDTAKNLLAIIKNFDMPQFDLEIHIDVGNNGKTKDMIQELTAMIRANNFEPKTKPYSYAASSVADRHNNKKRKIETKNSAV